MAEVRVNLYEGMFLLNQQSVAADLSGAVEHIREILNRAEAEIIVLSKWDERKLAYEIRGQKRGLFVLAYFKARASQIANIDRDCNLSEQVLRAMIIRADYMGEEEIELAKKNAELAFEARLRSGGEGAGQTRPEKAAVAADVASEDDAAGEGEGEEESN